jgi:predicted dehydrogenase
MPPTTPTRLAVIGAGAFGRNHLRVYRELESTHPVQLAAVVDANEETRAAAAQLYNIPAFGTVSELLGAGLDLHAASVCVPTIHHAEVASLLIEAGLDVLIEKPFAASLEEADRILALAARHGRMVAIGHLERFNPAVTATVERLNQPMFFEAHRLSLFTPRSLDVDVVLDLMIHDLDIVLSLAQSEVVEVRATGIPILSRKTDIANVRVEFASGAVANFTASRVSTEQVRKLRLFQPHQYLSLDFARQELLTISVDPALAEQIAGGYRPPATVPASHPTTGFDLQKLDLPRAEPLRLELEDFLRAVLTRTPPRVTAAHGREALKLALEINSAIAAHHQRAGLL